MVIYRKMIEGLCDVPPPVTNASSDGKTLSVGAPAEPALRRCQEEEIEGTKSQEKSRVTVDDEAEALPRRPKAGRSNKCPLCARTFTRPANLTTHLKETHGKVKGFRCSICKKTFARKYNKQVHERTHMKLKATKHPHVCKLCSERFSKQSRSIITHDVHERTHMKLKATKHPHVCKLCGERFSQRSNLKRHLLVRHEKRGKCPKCEARFDSDSDFERHWNDAHRGEKVKFLRKIGLRVRQNNLKCICSEQFQILKDLKDHQAKCALVRKQLEETSRQEDVDKSAAAAAAANPAAEQQHQTQQQLRMQQHTAAARGSSIGTSDSSAPRSPSRPLDGNATSFSQDQLAAGAAVGMAPLPYFRYEQDLINAFRHLIRPSASPDSPSSKSCVEPTTVTRSSSQGSASDGSASDLAERTPPTAHVPAAAVALQSLHQQPQQNHAMSNIHGLGASPLSSQVDINVSHATATTGASVISRVSSPITNPISPLVAVPADQLRHTSPFHVPIPSLKESEEEPPHLALARQQTLDNSASEFPSLANQVTELPSLSNSATEFPSLVNSVTELPSLDNSASGFPSLASSATGFPSLTNSAAKLQSLAKSATELPSLESLSPLSVAAPPSFDTSAATFLTGDMLNAAPLHTFARSSSAQSSIPSLSSEQPLLERHSSATQSSANLPSRAQYFSSPALTHTMSAPLPNVVGLDISTLKAVRPPSREYNTTSTTRELIAPVTSLTASTSPMAPVSSSAAISDAIVFLTLAMADTTPIASTNMASSAAALQSLPMSTDAISSNTGAIGTHGQTDGAVQVGNMPPPTSFEVIGARAPMTPQVDPPFLTNLLSADAGEGEH